MDQRHLLPEPQEPVTDIEVRALVERFGERQAMAQGQTTVQDVAEALQVDPATVGEMLVELRASKDQQEIKQRLDNLERENAELRERTSALSGLHTPFADSRVRQPFMIAMIVSLVIVAVMAKSGLSAGPYGWQRQFAMMALFFLPLFLIGRRFFRGFRR